MRRVRLDVGPVDGRVARAWLDNSRQIVRAIRARRPAIEVASEVLDLIEAYLTMWYDAALVSDPFSWSVEVVTSDLQVIATHWSEIASLSDAELAAMGCTWAPAWTQPMYDALVAAFVAALAQDAKTAAVADEFRARPPGHASDAD